MLIAAVGVVAVIAVLFFTGILSIPGLEAFAGVDTDEFDHPDAEYCGYGDMEILNMIELIVDKNLNNQVGLGFVDALNMKACGLNDKSSGDVLQYYSTLYDDWYTYFDETESGAGYSARMIIWTNEPSAMDSTLAKSVIVFEGVTVEELYDYEVVYLRSEGTILTYLGFFNWIESS